MTGKILVLGSSNVDLILRVPRFHQPGETIQANGLTVVFGGKGANQAVASKRLGGEVSFVTKLGNDSYGKSYRRYLIKLGLHGRSILMDKKIPTGMAFIELDPRGENRIVVFRGANEWLRIKDLKGISLMWETVRVFVSQLEIPISTVSWALKMAKKYGALTLLNPSPPLPVPQEIFPLVDYLIPNELEAQIFAGLHLHHEKDYPKIAQTLLSKGVKNVVITLGPKGLYFKNDHEEIWMKAFKVKVVDTTAAGDAFMGALACALSEEKPIREALRFANAAGALATTKLGAQPSLPYRKEVEVFLKE
jgi:ribokinase